MMMIRPVGNSKCGSYPMKIKKDEGSIARSKVPFHQLSASLVTLILCI